MVQRPASFPLIVEVPRSNPNATMSLPNFQDRHSRCNKYSHGHAHQYSDWNKKQPKASLITN